VASRGTPATALLTKQKVRFTTHPYDPDPHAGSYGEAAAAALGADPRRVFKTLVATVDGRLAVGVVPVSSSLDLKALAAALGGKRAAMAEPAAAERATGYVTLRSSIDGGLSSPADSPDPGLDSPPPMEKITKAARYRVSST
jgi:Cys-tRNA(Pro)/Cys-tRNA(Cys) deacylase